MAIQTQFNNWQVHHPAPDPAYSHCSPNEVLIFEYLAKRWGFTDLGCYGIRPIRLGTAPSTHEFGAARDMRYMASLSRARALAEPLPWLIDNSLELHVQAIHDYVGCRIWHAGRTINVDDCHTAWWKMQTPNTGNGMGQAWAGYFHVEVHPDGWHDDTPLADRFNGDVPQPTPTPTPSPTPTPNPPPYTGVSYVQQTIKLGSTGADVYAWQIILKLKAGNTDILCDGGFGPITDQGTKAFQAWFGLTADGVVGPVTWAKANQVVNA